MYSGESQLSLVGIVIEVDVKFVSNIFSSNI